VLTTGFVAGRVKDKETRRKEWRQLKKVLGGSSATGPAAKETQ
jgi:hypothetical protein